MFICMEKDKFHGVGRTMQEDMMINNFFLQLLDLKGVKRKIITGEYESAKISKKIQSEKHISNRICIYRLIFSFFSYASYKRYHDIKTSLGKLSDRKSHGKKKLYIIFWQIWIILMKTVKEDKT